MSHSWVRLWTVWYFEVCCLDQAHFLVINQRWIYHSECMNYSSWSTICCFGFVDHFAGHLAGILVGMLYIKGPLKSLMDTLVPTGSYWNFIGELLWTGHTVTFWGSFFWKVSKTTSLHKDRDAMNYTSQINEPQWHLHFFYYVNICCCCWAVYLLVDSVMWMLQYILDSRPLPCLLLFALSTGPSYTYRSGTTGQRTGGAHSYNWGSGHTTGYRTRSAQDEGYVNSAYVYSGGMSEEEQMAHALRESLQGR